MSKTRYRLYICSQKILISVFCIRICFKNSLGSNRILCNYLYKVSRTHQYPDVHDQIDLYFEITIILNGIARTPFTPNSKNQMYCASTRFTTTNFLKYDKRVGALQAMRSLSNVCWAVFGLNFGTYQLVSLTVIGAILAFSARPWTTTLLTHLSFQYILVS